MNINVFEFGVPHNAWYKPTEIKQRICSVFSCQLSTIIIIYLADWSVEIRLKNALARIIAWGKCQDHYLFKLWIIPYNKKYILANYRNYPGVMLYQPFNESKNSVLFIWYQYIIQHYCYIYNNIIKTEKYGRIHGNIVTPW